MRATHRCANSPGVPARAPVYDGRTSAQSRSSRSCMSGRTAGRIPGLRRQWPMAELECQRCGSLAERRACPSRPTERTSCPSAGLSAGQPCRGNGGCEEQRVKDGQENDEMTSHRAVGREIEDGQRGSAVHKECSTRASQSQNHIQKRRM